MRNSFGFTLGLLALADAGAGAGAVTPSTCSQWNGYERLDFEVDGRACLLVLPKTPAPGKPWIWRTEFFGHEPQGDVALLGKGFHVAYMDVQNLYGAPVALDHMDAFYTQLTAQFGLSPKTVLEGFSRGGLFAFNWAARNPQRTAAVYVDAPVLDFKSWPGGKGRSPGSPGDWERLQQVYAFASEAEALDYKLNPVDNLAPLARAGIPILSVCGETDRAVPIEENSRVVEQRYRALGGPITLIAKPFCDHHPHSLQDPTLIVNFVLRSTGLADAVTAEAATPYGYDYFSVRGGLANCRATFAQTGQGRVAFLGGSITAGGGWREHTCNELKQRFPQTQFDFINAGISSFGSVPGAFRFQRDVLGRGPVDLLFVEAAVNDEVNGQSDVNQVRGMEGIVRQARLANPVMDIVMLQFADPAKLKEIGEGRVPAVIANHEQVAVHYAVPSINLALEVAERIHAGEFTWEKDFRDLHPSPFGHTLYANAIRRLFAAVWASPLPLAAAVQPYALPAQPVDEKSFFHGHLVDIGQAVLENGWRIDPCWEATDKAGTRAGFVKVPMLVAEQPGARLRLTFNGNAVGVFVAAGPDAGTLEYRVDGGPVETCDLFFVPYSAGLHLNCGYLFTNDLAAGEHEIALTMSATANPKSTGHAARITHFLVNGP